MISDCPTIYRRIALQFPVRKARRQSTSTCSGERNDRCLCNVSPESVGHYMLQYVQYTLQRPCSAALSLHLAILAPPGHLKPRLLWTLQAAHGPGPADSHAASSCLCCIWHSWQQLLWQQQLQQQLGVFKFSGRNLWLGTKTRTSFRENYWSFEQ